MENPTDEAPSEANSNVYHISSNKEEGQVVDEHDILGEKHKEIFLDQSNGTDKEYYNSLDEVNIPANEKSSEAMIDKDISSDQMWKDKNIILGDERNRGPFEDIHRQDSEVLDEDSISVKEQNKSIDKDVFPILNTDDNHTTVEDGLAFYKGILEEDINSDESTPQCKPGIVTDSVLLDPLSPVGNTDESDAELDVQETEKELRSTRKELSLPYFQLPKPDLDEFLIETEKNLEIPVKSIENKISMCSPVQCKPQQKNIVSLKPPTDVKGKFFDPKKVFITLDLSPNSSPAGPSRKKSSVPQSSHEVLSGSFNNEYEKVLSSINVDESKTPGIKRLALKEFLKKQIDQKRYEAFNQSKMLNIEDEEMEGMYFEKEEGPEISDEDSSDEYEEATVSFEQHNQKLGDGLESGDESALTKEPEECQINDESSSDESDEDFIGVRKIKNKFLVLEDDSCDADYLNEEKKDYDSLDMESSCQNELKVPEIMGNKLNGKSDDKLTLNGAENCNRDTELCKNAESAFGVGIFQTSESNSVLSQISSSMPSYQPGGGFLNQDLRQDDSSDSVTSSSPSQQSVPDNVNEDLYAHLQPGQKLLGSSKTPDLENGTVLENASSIHSDDSNGFRVKLDDLPVTQSVNDSDIFLTEELADVCSGAFNKTEAVSEKQLERDEKHTFEEKVTDFFDDEAELSGEDDGVDEKDDADYDGDNLDLYASDEDNLPAAEVLREEIADLHMKRMMDEDEERIKAIQEQFLDDGELNNDGAGRSRRFAWINNDMEMAPAGNNSDSDSDEDVVDDSLNQEKAKWRQENKEDENLDLTEELNSSGCRRRSFFKVDIVGKPKFCHDEDSSKRLSCKRPSGSYLNLDHSFASQVLKKLRASEDNFGGSRTTKHFVFRNDSPDVSVLAKEVSVKSVSKNASNSNGSPRFKSVFTKF